MGYGPGHTTPARKDLHPLACAVPKEEEKKTTTKKSTNISGEKHRPLLSVVVLSLFRSY